MSIACRAGRPAHHPKPVAPDSLEDACACSFWSHRTGFSESSFRLGSSVLPPNPRKNTYSRRRRRPSGYLPRTTSTKCTENCSYVTLRVEISHMFQNKKIQFLIECYRALF